MDVLNKWGEKMSRYIDADALPRHGQRGGLVHWKDIEEAPTIDAVSVVRCKECVRRKNNGFCLEHNRYEKNDNGYCSYGERKE